MAGDRKEVMRATETQTVAGRWSQRLSVTGDVWRQLDWAMRFPDTWANSMLGVSVRVFLDKINIEMGKSL